MKTARSRAISLRAVKKQDEEKLHLLGKLF